MTSLSPPIHGSIEPAVLPRVVRDLWRARASGVLDLRKRDIGRLIVFQNGNIVFAATNQKDERLGERLVRAGRIKRSDLDLAFRVMERSHERIGRTVVDLGWITPMDMQRFVATQIKEIVYSVFTWDEGHYRFDFESSTDALAEDASLQIKTAEVIFEGAHRISDVQAIRAGLGSLEQVAAFADGKKLSIPVTLEDGHLLSRVNGLRTLREIIETSPLAEEDSLRRVYALLLAEVLVLRESEAGVASVEAVSDRSMTDEERQFRNAVRARHAALPLGDLYDRLGVDFGGSEEKIREGFECVMASLEPHESFASLVGDLNDIVATLRQRARDAYETLSVAETRARYDREFAHAAPGSSLADPETATALGPSERAGEPATARDPVEAELCYYEASRLFTAGDYFDAVASLTRAVQFDPDNPAYHCLLGQWLSQNPGCWDAAQAHFERAITLDVANVDAHLGLAALYEDSDASNEAMALYEKILVLEPENAVAREKLQPQPARSANS